MGAQRTGQGHLDDWNTWPGRDDEWCILSINSYQGMMFGLRAQSEQRLGEENFKSQQQFHIFMLMGFYPHINWRPLSGYENQG